MLQTKPTVVWVRSERQASPASPRVGKECRCSSFDEKGVWFDGFRKCGGIRELCPRVSILIFVTEPSLGAAEWMRLLLLLGFARVTAISSLPHRAAAAWILSRSPCTPKSSAGRHRSACHVLSPLNPLHPRRAFLTTMADTGKGKGGAGASTGGGKAKATDKLGEAEVLNLVLDYLATKGFTEAEQTLRQSVTAGQGSPKKGHNSNQQSGTLAGALVRARLPVV